MSPYDFWKATLNNCQSSYKKWVHMYEARIAGVDVYKKNLKKDDVSVYARNRRNKQETIVANQWWLIINSLCEFIINTIFNFTL